jgi:hypothetical protein
MTATGWCDSAKVEVLSGAHCFLQTQTLTCSGSASGNTLSGLISRRDLATNDLVTYYRLARDVQNGATIREMLDDDPVLRALFWPAIELTHAEAVALARQIVRRLSSRSTNRNPSRSRLSTHLSTRRTSRSESKSVDSKRDHRRAYQRNWARQHRAAQRNATHEQAT